MPTPAKPAKVIALEGKSHRTKEELRERERAEAQLLSGKKLKESREVAENKAAHKEFLRLEKLLQAIGKDDDLYGASINRYCLLQAECTEFEEARDRLMEQLRKMEEQEEEFPDIVTFYKLQSEMQKNLTALDRQIQAKRKMLLDLEKENVMTISASLRSIPKKAEKKANPLREALSG